MATDSKGLVWVWMPCNVDEERVEFNPFETEE